MPLLEEYVEKTRYSTGGTTNSRGFLAEGFEFLCGADLQFTDSKNAKGITSKKLGSIHLP
jgi:hypothetical protein